MIRLVKDDVTRQQIDQILEEAGFKLKQHIETQFAATVCNFVMNGAGIAVISPFAALDFSAHGLVMRRFRPVVTASYAMVMPVLRPPSAVTRKFIALLAEERDRVLTDFAAI